ncbi:MULTISPECIES: TcpQ domain-containing protein [Citrobacter]|jgi:toxin co-regulated pilus biosynthesis protein Q|nr:MULTISPECIES: TcpQ domain-containing protein [Citrobacter]MDM3431339.1 toxin co-regulated pilus biosynthesis Q family protein [Citrobacter sp. Cb023]MDM3435424.1 toxin co-regulated pilus biosynthesis Q family protein [Citrobacter sp. Cb034]MDV0578223.1 TcpQ domain-containing protein [Citrobacter braakii]MDW2594428.1 TcpQ domain-containing protein [Citrobacter braakii]MDW2658241.1 TcpQ domain-containing protein [Citrobacter braakii]
MKESPINHWKSKMKKTWIIGAAVSALLGSQGSFAASAPAGQKIDAGMLTTTPVKESTTTPRNPFSGDDTVKSVAPVSAPVVEIKIDLLEEELLSQQLTKWAQQNGYKLLWNSSTDFVIYKAIHLQGKSIQDVLVKLGQVFTSENYGLVIKDYQANNVLIIDEQ